MTAEEEVRAAWSIGKVMLYEDGRFWITGDEICPIFFADASAALDFTRKIKQEIAEIEEEIAWLKNVQFSYTCLHDLENRSKPWKRVLSRLTAQRDELKKGMRD